MSSMSNFFENEIADHIFGGNTYSPADIYIALCTAAPTDSSTGTSIVEPSGGSYARQQLSAGANWTVSGAAASNTATITFPTATGSWDTITHVAIVDALTVGNLLFHGALTTSKAITTDDVFQFGASDLTITFD